MKRRYSADHIALLAVVLCQACDAAFGGDVAYIEKVSGATYTLRQVESVGSMYGLAIDTTLLTGVGDNAAAAAAISNANNLAVVIAADALPHLDKRKVLAAMKKGDRRIPLLIVGITDHIDSALLRQWSGGAIADCRKAQVNQAESSYGITRDGQIARQLGGIKLPVTQGVVDYFTFTRIASRWLMATLAPGRELPIFARVMNGAQETFFTAALPASVPVTPDPYRQPEVFATVAPIIMFLRYAAGERAWHTPGAYANLTIDDVWLREPYGHVSHKQLLREMQQHNFHTTMAFIPWNFDRSQPDVVSIFQDHPERFSICVHGNNHDHQEFGPYDAHPLATQVENIKQGIARMERFTRLTKIAYDRVMVFPHEISPEPTLAALKRYNFLATANSRNVPSGASAPSKLEFALRAPELGFANFASIRRYSAEVPIPDAQISVDAFLGNPLLFYAHEGFFKHGMDAFNDIADKVNRLQADTQWRSLGEIARHLYLEKRRPDGNYDIRVYTRAIQLTNTHTQDATFLIEKEEDFAFPLRVRVDGQAYSYERSGKQLHLEIPIRAGMSRSLEIEYENDLNLASINISKLSLRVHIIRHLSDFRDNVVSQSGLGRRFIRSYTDNDIGWDLAAVVLLGLMATAVTRRYQRR